MADVKLAPGAEKVALAGMLSDVIQSNLERPEKMKDFNKLRARVFINAVDADIMLTMEFNCGTLTFYGGREGVPDLSIETDGNTLLDLANINIKYGMPWYFDEQGMDIVKKLLKRELRIKGLINHPMALTRLTKVISIN